jgi:hypothetical protein
MLTGPKPRLNVCEIYPIPIRLQPASEEHDDLALFNHDIDSKLRGSRSNNERQRGSCYIVKRSLLPCADRRGPTSHAAVPARKAAQARDFKT